MSIAKRIEEVLGDMEPSSVGIGALICGIALTFLKADPRRC